MSISKTIVENDLRTRVFERINLPTDFIRVSNQSFGTFLTDLNDEKRMVEVRLIVRKLDEEFDGEELLHWEAEEYEADKEEKAKKKERLAEEKKNKIEKSRARRRKKEEEEE